ncbi:hypothetical protein ACPPVT_21460 [Angustibacter sp. McL0619]|uniref:hypothetical protein n=1 Tax=Angustibacter sp. McL0619 TaxID=3415676 RepID=UPI003CEDF04E
MLTGDLAEQVPVAHHTDSALEAARRIVRCGSARSGTGWTTLCWPYLWLRYYR